MSADDGTDILRELRAAKWRSRRRVGITVGLNLLVAAAFLVFPWWRGRARGADAREGFAAFAACLLGGRAAEGPGLALPRGAWDRFAFLALDDSARARRWPRRCVAAIDGISPPGDPPSLMLPWVRSAEVELDDALPALRRAMERLADARERGPLRVVPSDVPNAIENVVAKLSYLANEAGSAPDLERPTLDDARFESLESAIRPTRVFLGYRGDTSLAMRVAERGALHLVLWDRSRTGTASVTERGPREHRILPTPPAWGPIRDATGRTWLVRISRREQCGDQCDRRATGIAALDVVAGRIAPVVWLRASVVGRPDRSMAIAANEARVIAGDGDRLSLVVLDATTGERRTAHELVGFGRPDATGAAHPPATIVMVADRERTVVVDAGRFAPPPAPQPRVDDGGSADGRSGSGSDESEGGSGAAAPPLVRGPRIAVLDARGLRVLPALPALEGRDAWALACRAGARTWIALGTTTAVRIATLDDADDRLVLGAVHATGAADGIGLDDVDGDGQRLRCDPRGATLAVERHTPPSLTAIVCERDVASCTERTLAAAGDAREWDLVRTEGGHVVAWSAARAGTQIRVQALDARLAHRHGPVAPTVCWEPERGLCGRPRLVVDGRSVLLAAALSASVVVLRSDDGGMRWSGFEGRRERDGVR
ncbi:MAG: hypothetical protein IT379_40390 [Deltaproteobacteria bacterium]|nr:hypothetical protein [Deltaproteobacteria bacterium]